MMALLLSKNYMNFLFYSHRCTQGITQVAKSFRIKEFSSRTVALGNTLRIEGTLLLLMEYVSSHVWLYSLEERLHGYAELVECCFYNPRHKDSWVWRVVGLGPVRTSISGRAQYTTSNKDNQLVLKLCVISRSVIVLNTTKAASVYLIIFKNLTEVMGSNVICGTIAQSILVSSSVKICMAQMSMSNGPPWKVMSSK